MIVCHCRVVSDREIRDAIACGAVGVCELAAACETGTRCGGCLPAVRQLLAQHGLPTDEHLTVDDLRREVIGVGSATPRRAAG